MTRDLGDWQTPDAFASSVLSLLHRMGITGHRLLEPTCGEGSFISAALTSPAPPAEVIGLDMQECHLRTARARFAHTPTPVLLLRRNIFETDLAADLHWRTTGPLLIVGNPPWVTNAELGSAGSANLPSKSNLKGLKGLDAKTGAANFDIAEFITLKLIAELASQQPVIALLLKTAVARNVIQHCRHARWPLAQASLHRFDAGKAFGASVDACLLVARIGHSNQADEIPVFDSFDAPAPSTIMGFTNGTLVPDIPAYRRARHIDGRCGLIWRQGIKHDAASVMELRRSQGELRNRSGEPVDIEPDYVFPLIKGTQLFHGHTSDTENYVIVTQRALGEDTRALAATAPRLWAYLNAHSLTFDRRRSSIYLRRPPFSIFGVGDYTFTPFKVAVSGLHKVPRFRLLGPINDRPVILDDTCYLLPSASPGQAALLGALLNEHSVADLLKALMFPDTKRPITKGVLQRIDLLAALRTAQLERLLRSASSIAEHLAPSAPLPATLPELEGLVTDQLSL